MSAQFSNNRRRNTNIKGIDLKNDSKGDKESLLTYCTQILKRPSNERSYPEKFVIQQMATNLIFLGNQVQFNQQLTENIADFLHYQKIDSNEILFHQGEQSSRFYILMKGVIGVRINLPQENGYTAHHEIKEIYSGEAFGELAFEEQSQRAATHYAKTDCDLAYLEKRDYEYLIGDEIVKKREEKLTFLRQYPFFKTWSMNELKVFASNFYEKDFIFNDKIFNQRDLCNNLYFVKKGNIELQEILQENYDPKVKNQHPNYLNKKTKTIKPMCIICEFDIFGEDFFFDESGESTFMIKKNQLIQSSNRDDKFLNDNSESVLSTQDDINKSMENLIQKVQRHKYSAVCSSNSVKVYFIKIDVLETLFYDPATRRSFSDYIKSIWDSRVDKFNVNQVKITNLLEFDSSKEKDQTLIKNQNKHTGNFSDFLQHNYLSNDMLMKDQQENSTSFSKQLEKDVDQLRREDTDAMELFKQLYLRMNKSYGRTKSFYQSRNLFQDKLFYESFLVSHKKKRDNKSNVKVVQNLPLSTRKKCITSDHIETKGSHMNSSFDYLQYGDATTLPDVEKDFQLQLGQDACLFIKSTSKNKYSSLQKYKLTGSVVSGNNSEIEDMSQFPKRPQTTPYQYQKLRDSNDMKMLHKTEASGIVFYQKKQAVHSYTRGISTQFNSSVGKQAPSFTGTTVSGTISASRKLQMVNTFDDQGDSKPQQKRFFRHKNLNLNQKRSKSYETYFYK